MHLNCRRLYSNWEKFQDLLCDMHSDIFSFDYIGTSEVILTNAFHTNDGHRGGVAPFIKDTSSYKIRNDLSVFIAHVYESLFVEVTQKIW